MARMKMGNIVPPMNNVKLPALSQMKPSFARKRGPNPVMPLTIPSLNTFGPEESPKPPKQKKSKVSTY